MLDEHHFNKHDRVCAGTAHLVIVQRIQPLIQPVVVHDLLDFAQKMVFGYEHIYVNNHCFAAGVFGVLFHEGASLGGFLLLYQKPSRLRRLLGEYSLTN